MGLEWMPATAPAGKVGDRLCMPVAELWNVNAPTETDMVQLSMPTEFSLYCDHHWDTGAPTEWLLLFKGLSSGVFASKQEAMDFAEVTYELKHVR